MMMMINCFFESPGNIVGGAHYRKSSTHDAQDSKGIKVLSLTVEVIH